MTISEEEADRLLDDCQGLERQMLTMTTLNASDFAAKLLAITSDGRFALEDDADRSFINEARALVASEGGDA